MAQQRTTYAHLVGSLTETLKQAFANYELSELQILYWVVAGVNSVKQAEMESGKLTGSYLQTFTQVPVSINYSEGNNIFAKRKYIHLPANILDLTDDRAVEWMCYYSLQVKPLKTTKGNPIWFERETLTHVMEAYHLPFGKPTQKEPNFVRVNDKLYLFGVEDTPIPGGLDMALYTSINPSALDVEPDDEVFLNDEQIGKVFSYVTGIGRFMLSVPAPNDRKMVADGTDQSLNVPKQFINSQAT